MKTRIIQDQPPEPDSVGTPAEIRPASPVRGLVRAHRLPVFFVLAYLFAWGALPWHSFLAAGPLIAALIVAYVADGVAGPAQIGRRLIRWRVRWVWYALALGVPLAVDAATLGLTTATGAPAPDPGRYGLWLGLPMALGLALINPVNGPLGEEPAFRGYALPLLQNRRTPLVSAAVLAVLVAGWHGPLFFLPEFGLRPYEVITTIAVTFWYVWLFDHAAGSSLLTLIAHAAEGSLNVDGLYPDGGADATRAVVINLLLWCAVAVTLLVTGRRFWTAPAPPEACDPGGHPDRPAGPR